MDQLLGNSHSLRVVSTQGEFLQLYFGRWEKISYPKIGNIEMLANESLPLDYARHSCKNLDYCQNPKFIWLWHAFVVLEAL